MGLPAILARGESAGSVIPVAQPAPAPVTAQTWGQFWREFLRVEFEVVLLFGLIFYLFHIGQNELAKGCILALAVAIKHNRFRWN